MHNCENNKYAISVPQKLQMAVDDISLRASGYGMPSDVVDGTDFLQVYNATVEAVQRALNGEGPTLIEAKLERFLPHTSDDDDTRYREPEELQLAKQSSDPVAKFKEFLIVNKIMTKDQSAQIIPLSGYPASNFVNKVHPKVSWYLSELREG